MSAPFRDRPLTNAELLRQAMDRREEVPPFDAVRAWLDRHARMPASPEWETRDEWLNWAAENLLGDPELYPYLAAGERDRITSWLRGVATQCDVEGGVLSRMILTLATRIEEEVHWRPGIAEPFDGDPVEGEIALLSDEAMTRIVHEASAQQRTETAEQERRYAYEYLKAGARELERPNSPHIDRQVAANNLVRLAGEILRGLHVVPEKINNPELWK